METRDNIATKEKGDGKFRHCFKGLRLSQEAKTRRTFTEKGCPFPMLTTRLLQLFSATKDCRRKGTEWKVSCNREYLFYSVKNVTQ